MEVKLAFQCTPCQEANATMKGHGSKLHAAAVRVVVLLVWMVIALLTPLERYSNFDPAVFEGFGVGRLLYLFPWTDELLQSSRGLLMLRITLGVAGVVALVSDRHSRAAGYLVFVCAVAVDGIVKGLGGFANHQQTIALLALGVVTFVSVEGGRTLPDLRRLRLSSRSETSQSSRMLVTASALVIALPYTFVGAQRLMSGGPGLFSGFVMLEHLAAATRGFGTFPESFDAPSWRTVINLGFAIATLLEATAFMVLFAPKYRRVWLVAIGMFHVLTVGLMNILFLENIALSYVTLWSSPRRGTIDDS